MTSLARVAAARAVIALFVSVCVLGLAACAPMSSETSPAAANASTSTPTAAAETASSKASVDFSCSSDAQCTVKDVGSCCGYRPACVNVDSPTFPAQVQADCAAEGRSGICGFADISACQCVDQRCEAAPAASAVLLQD